MLVLYIVRAVTLEQAPNINFLHKIYLTCECEKILWISFSAYISVIPTLNNTNGTGKSIS